MILVLAVLTLERGNWMTFEKLTKRKDLDWKEEAEMKASKKRTHRTSNKRNWSEDNE